MPAGHCGRWPWICVVILLTCLLLLAFLDRPAFLDRVGPTMAGKLRKDPYSNKAPSAPASPDATVDDAAPPQSNNATSDATPNNPTQVLQNQLLKYEQYVRNSSTSPLEPWLQNVLQNDWNVTTMPSCFSFEAGIWGLGSTLNNVLWGATIIQQLKPGAMIYYDHRPSYYQCSTKKTVDAFLLPAGNFIRTGQPPQDCHIMDFTKMVDLVQNFMANWDSSFIWERHRSASKVPDHITPQQWLDRRMLLNAAFQALCPVVSDWWSLSPELQAEVDRIKQQVPGKAPVIAIHARGGDKASELGGYIDSRTQKYPMQQGMQRLITLHPAVTTSAPTCIIVGDDYSYAQSVRQWANSTLHCSKVIMRTPNVEGAAFRHPEFISKPMEQRCAATKNYVVDVELMAWATFLVGNHRANGDTLAMYVRKCKYYHDYSTAVPGTGAAFFPLWQ